jgi:hypothetical protein
LLPNTTKLDLDLEAVHEILSIGRLKLREVSGKKLGKYTAKITNEVVQVMFINP